MTTENEEGKSVPGIDIVVLGNSFEAFGTVLDLLSRQLPFGSYRLAAMASAVRLQLQNGHHVAAVRGPTLVGYLGWMATSEAIARSWQENEGALVPVPPPHDDAFAVTIVASTDPACTRRMTRATRAFNPGKRAFFKRGSAKRSVFNATAE